MVVVQAKLLEKVVEFPKPSLFKWQPAARRPHVAQKQTQSGPARKAEKNSKKHLA